MSDFKKLYEENLLLKSFGEYSFTDEVMQEMLDPETFSTISAVKRGERELDRELANVIAEKMKIWAISKGATHYTHWFQPLTDNTAEKHDSFFEFDKSGKVILDFSGKQLIKGEADASSLPSGGTRATFEARGYTVWDCTSPAFIKESNSGLKTLCIPTAFCSYTGMALDKKTPLLRSMEALNTQALRVLRALGNTSSTHVELNLGAEQEYFLVDKSHYLKRKDLIFTGRTLFGAKSPKGQEKNDQYYAVIKDRVTAFMDDLNHELWKLGITAKTQHNEVAPCQHELACIYTSANIATDQNQIIMEKMRTVADKHGLACLLHEKPFATVNGSGKHCNFSLSTNDGINLLAPGKTPEENLVFLVFFAAVISAVDEYAELFRMSASHPGNDHRLGANEAPPAIVSVFIGEHLEEIFENINDSLNRHARVNEYLEIGVKSLPHLKRDNSDRNRTSPFAFTGNKFEFRMVGASATTATPSLVFSTTVADSLMNIADNLESEKGSTSDKVASVLKKLLDKHHRVVYSGNNYSKEWIAEAKRRGLPNIETSLDSYYCLTSEKSVGLFTRQHVMTELELCSRREVYFETYEKTINIETRTALSMLRQEIIPSLISYIGELANTVKNLKAIGVDSSVEEKLCADLSAKLRSIYLSTERLARAIDTADNKDGYESKANYMKLNIIPLLQSIRSVVDETEVLFPKDKAPFPSYTDILFYD